MLHEIQISVFDEVLDFIRGKKHMGMCFLSC